MTLGGFLEDAERRFPNNTAVTFGEYSLDYAGLLRESRLLARGLIASGISKGDKVGIWCDDRPKALVSLYACAFVGAVFVLIGTSLNSGEVEALVENTDITMLLYGDGYRGMDFPPVAADLLHAVPALHECVYIGETPGAHTPDYAALLKRGSAIGDGALKDAERGVHCEDTACILFTSGTVGAAKGVMTSHFSRVNSAIFQARDLAADERDRFCVAIPMFHCFSLSASVLAAAAVGGCVCFPESRHTADILHTIEARRCTVLHAVPTLFSALAARDDLSDFDLSSLRIGLIGGSSYEPELLIRIREALGYNILPSLGLTEATAGITVARPDDPLDVIISTVGHFMDGAEGRIAAVGSGPRSYTWLGSGETGEVCVRGYGVMQGYYRQPELTLQVIDAEGFLHTGDLGFIDKRGDLHLTGRLKELIIRGGENITPSEVERAILSDERASEVKAVGVSDAHYGEEICACVVKRAGCSMSEDDVRAAAARLLAYFKVPRYVLFFDSLPVTPSGKVRTAELRALAETRLGR